MKQFHSEVKQTFYYSFLVVSQRFHLCVLSIFTVFTYSDYLILLIIQVVFMSDHAHLIEQYDIIDKYLKSTLHSKCNVR